MSDITLIILSAGDSTRFSSKVKKQWIRVGDKPIWKFVLDNFKTFYNFDKIVVTASKDELNYKKVYDDSVLFVEGGKSRQESLNNALQHVNSSFVLVHDVARVLTPKEMILNIIDNKTKADCIVPVLNVSDTVIYKEETIDRDLVKLIQTPQLSKTDILKKSLLQDIIYTDDSSAIKSIGGTVYYVNGSESAKKLTFLKDLIDLNLPEVNRDFFVGSGYDVHAFEQNKKMYLCGIEIDVDYGFKAHSDGDVAIHALIDAMLGAIGYGDVGELFPDNDMKYKNIDSKILLNEVFSFLTKVGYEIVNIDITIMAEQPKLKNYKYNMRKSLANLLQLEAQKVNIKATTTEKLGFVGRCEGVAVSATCLVKYFDWKNL
ncbi:MAG: bifunctional 2-C-methyl-D-erythritol 4-phosphate cytidylyltransferase/2-C-methyl-D-erythritol 2,4-cyclodiphosphate synthase [Campylobacterales bacterium]|nr:bifunctional 2-C-methyl-D-erythritol 4-phosphate cytidylyltransferase/2-C-methyl-D-erythritol 2,4-cyclodiphosphate synthase [Campylobacterales bacterium]